MRHPQFLYVVFIHLLYSFISVSILPLEYSRQAFGQIDTLQSAHGRDHSDANGQGTDGIGLNSGTPAVLETGTVIPDSAFIDSLYKFPNYQLDRKITNTAFRPGEKLTFNIRYGIIHAGVAKMEVVEKTTLQDSIPVYRILTTAKSASFFDNFYKVRDSVETYLDATGYFSWRYEKRLREGGYKFDLLVDYDQPRGIANVHAIRYNKEEPLTIRNQEMYKVIVEKYIADVLSAFYYVRTQNLEVGEPLYMSNHDNKKVYDLQVIVQRRETIKVKAGKFKCILVKPRLQGDAIFKQKGELWVWLTDDEYKIPVKMKSKVAVGSISTELNKIEGVPLPITAQIK